MKRRFFPVLLAFAASLSGAGQTALAQSSGPNFELRKTVCPTVAQQAGFAYSAKQGGTPFELTQALLSTPMRPLYQWAADYAQTKATDLQNAVQASVEKCLRNVDLVDSNAQKGKWTTVEELQ